MAFSTINSSQVDALSPLDVILFGQIKDNFDDLGAGITTASAFTGANNIDAAAGVLRTSVSGFNSVTISNATSTSVFEATGLELTCARDGSFRVFWSVQGVTGGTLETQVYRNASAIGSTFTGDGPKSDDITGNTRGDVLQIYRRFTQGNATAVLEGNYLGCSTATTILSAST